MRLPRLPTTKSKEPAKQTRPPPDATPISPTTTTTTARSTRDSRGSRLSTRDPDVNRANVLDAIEKHYLDLKTLFLENKLRKNETWRWLQDRGYKGSAQDDEGEAEDREKRRVFRFTTPPEPGEDTVRVNSSYVILKIHPDGQLEEVWMGIKPSELNARRSGGNGGSGSGFC